MTKKEKKPIMTDHESKDDQKKMLSDMLSYIIPAIQQDSPYFLLCIVPGDKNSQMRIGCLGHIDTKIVAGALVRFLSNDERLWYSFCDQVGVLADALDEQDQSELH